ncbi:MULTISPECIES: SHOCT domain-containing protein [Mycobacteriaceae]|uniref:SHOCT domain-containing protein n=1 Tax=Mycolicibacterium frederiksbergense TaxID=117567 RepID=A0A6H0S4I4_9MYCO|nr:MULTISPECIES: SHOCT domain-containing protein [Mycobacteriaceae]QIV82413.1 SHOCT domain-containing protein [Mycolicibacterium frederiksbergense]UXA17794.1 SHOCT domain-containing protein [Mycobacterium sp. SMC-4]
MMYGTDGCMWGGWGWGGWILMGAVMVLLSAVLITAVVLAVRYLAGSDTQRNRADSVASPRPEGVLAQRFARGDIDEDEFRRRLTLLREHQESR